MGGRIYDPILGRFLQADPFIQAPHNSQSFNRYSYVLNNPMTLTDPSGYISINPFKKLRRNIIKAAVKVFGAELVNTVGSFVSTFYGGAFGAGAWSYEFSRAMGISSTGALKGAITATITTHVNLSDLSTIEKYAINSVIENVVGTNDTQTAVKTVGATNSSLTGGKFANGAASKASTELYSSMNPRLRQRAINKRISVETSGWWSNHVYDIKGQICTTDQIGCNDKLADRVFAHVDRNDVPFFGDDNAQGAMLLIPHIMYLSANPGIEGALARYLGPQPIIHESFPRKRTSRNETLPGHFFHYGDVTHRVYFEGNTLYYQVVGAGEGAGLINNVMGTELFLGGVRDVVNRYGL